ncbi:hypothetical protein J1605_005759 [Eschrichtius robustus]|uniref:Uncharacterized protein n=1 Tax=Eschrichtius robustus TaxID=9764 RepID=A0AB34H9N1_ESCRO|nr:hypothetical protein J1605_005759 [Eschrichtius robustus]
MLARHLAAHLEHVPFGERRHSRGQARQRREGARSPGPRAGRSQRRRGWDAAGSVRGKREKFEWLRACASGRGVDIGRLRRVQLWALRPPLYASCTPRGAECRVSSP